MAISFHLLVRSRLKYPGNFVEWESGGRLHIRGQARKGYRNCKKDGLHFKSKQKVFVSITGRKTSAESIQNSNCMTFAFRWFTWTLVCSYILTNLRHLLSFKVAQEHWRLHVCLNVELQKASPASRPRWTFFCSHHPCSCRLASWTRHRNSVTQSRKC